MARKKFSFSIVSHGHKRFIAHLLADLAALGRTDFEVILTLNLPEDSDIEYGAMPFPITTICNSSPKRFAENHNAAFVRACGDYFVILNPDIRLANDPFDALLTLLHQNPGIVCAPLIVNGRGGVEDSARNFPTPLFLMRKLLGKVFNVSSPIDFVPTVDAVSMPDWIAGMFIVVPRGIFEKLHGLDERYRMYYEDVDFCARARLAGYKVMVNGHVKVVHEAQRDSHRKMRYLFWHLRSALRFFTSKVFLRIQLRRLLGT